MASRGWRLAAAAAAFLGSVTLLVSTTSRPAHAATQTVQAFDVAEAWYSTVPISACTTPLCPPSPVPNSPYPAKTLHVGVAAGRETARTYVVPDLSVVPFGATVTSGQMTLPVATGSTDGSLRPQTAVMKACLVTQTVTDGTTGSTAKPPAVDNTVCNKATYDNFVLGFVVDLSPFLSRWTAGTANDGIALIPDLSKAGPTTTWHATFNGKDRTGTLRISSQLSYTPAVEQFLPPLVNAPAPPVVAVPPPVAVPPITPQVQQPPAPVPPPAVAAPPGQRTVAITGPGRFQYPAAFLLPLAFLAGAVFLFRLFTGDPTPVSVRR